MENILHLYFAPTYFITAPIITSALTPSINKSEEQIVGKTVGNCVWNSMQTICGEIQNELCDPKINLKLQYFSTDSIHYR